MMETKKSPTRILAGRSTKRLSDRDFSLPLLLLLIIISISSLAYFYLPSPSSSTASFLSVKFVPLKFPSSEDRQHSPPAAANPLSKSRIAVCLVGGARRFELTGPSIVDRILREFPNADLFLNSPLDSNSYKLFLLNAAPSIASIRIFQQEPIPETGEAIRVLTSRGSPNGVQGLLQYFDLVEGCLTLIKAHQQENSFTYDWIIRTRVDGYWSDDLGVDSFNPGKYTVPEGSSYGGLNDRFGVGDYNTSLIALSRLSSIHSLGAIGLMGLNSEGAFKAQLTINKIKYVTMRLPFCILSDRKYRFPPWMYGVPVAAMSNDGPLSGAKCRPCTAVCKGSCVKPLMSVMYKWWSWTEWGSNRLSLCDAHGEWEEGWEKVFDKVAGKGYGAIREHIRALDMDRCVSEFQKMKKRSAHWHGPTPIEICELGLHS